MVKCIFLTLTFLLIRYIVEAVLKNFIELHRVVVAGRHLSSPLFGAVEKRPLNCLPIFAPMPNTLSFQYFTVESVRVALSFYCSITFIQRKLILLVSSLYSVKILHFEF